MSLFDAAVEQVVKDVGKENVIAVKDRNMADYCKIWMLVVRKEHSWYWPWKPKYKYVPTEVTLIDILTEVRFYFHRVLLHLSSASYSGFVEFKKLN